MQQFATSYRRTNSLAIVSFVAALLGYLIPHPFIASTIAVITGHMARGQIRRNYEGGRGLATAGLVLGYIHLVLSFAFVLVVVLLLAGVVAFHGISHA